MGGLYKIVIKLKMLLSRSGYHYVILHYISELFELGRLFVFEVF